MFPSVPMASFRSSRKLNTYLDREKLCFIKLGTFSVQRKIVSDRPKLEIRSFNSTTTDIAYKLSYKFTCCDKCLVNLCKYKLV